jgi:hypothetical protein
MYGFKCKKSLLKCGKAYGFPTLPRNGDSSIPSNTGMFYSAAKGRIKNDA